MICKMAYYMFAIMNNQWVKWIKTRSFIFYGVLKCVNNSYCLQYITDYNAYEKMSLFIFEHHYCNNWKPCFKRCIYKFSLFIALNYHLKLSVQIIIIVFLRTNRTKWYWSWQWEWSWTPKNKCWIFIVDYSVQQWIENTETIIVILYAVKILTWSMFL